MEEGQLSFLPNLVQVKTSCLVDVLKAIVDDGCRISNDCNSVNNDRIKKHI